MPLTALVSNSSYASCTWHRTGKAFRGRDDRPCFKRKCSLDRLFHLLHLVNIGGAAGPMVASWVQHRMSVENVFRVAAFSVLLMFFAVLIFFREPRKQKTLPANVGRPPRTSASSGELSFSPARCGDCNRPQDSSIFAGFAVSWYVWLGLLCSLPIQPLHVVSFDFFRIWIVYWQEFIILPLYVHDYIDAKADTEIMLSTGPILVIPLTVVIGLLTQKMRAFRAITLGTLISALGIGFHWSIHPSVPMAYVAMAGVALGEIILSPRYYEYVSRLAPPGQQGTYLGFAFLPIGIGSLIRWIIWWKPHSPLWRSHSSTNRHVVGVMVDGVVDSAAVVDLRPHTDAERGGGKKLTRP